MKRPIKKTTKTGKQSASARPAKHNVRVTAQTRKLLGKHYANKYRVR